MYTDSLLYAQEFVVPIYYVSIHLSDGQRPSDKGTFHFGFLSVVRLGFLSVVRLGTDSFQQFNTDHFSTVITENRKNHNLQSRMDFNI